MNAKKSLGQNFLHDLDILQKISNTLNIVKSDIVVEIGGGHGELTQLLSSQKPAKLIVIEKDINLAILLQKKFNNHEIISGDALQKLPQINLPPNWKLIGNIPYYITGRLFRILSELQNPPEKTILLIQKEVANRVSSVAPNANLLSSMIRGWATPTYLFPVNRNSFYPVPQVDSAVISLEKKAVSAPSEYFSVTRAIFKQPRKKAVNNLMDSLKMERSQAENAFSACGLSLDLRPQNLTPENILCIAKKINNFSSDKN